MINKSNTTNFDFSQYDLYKKCPLSYKWKYIDKKVPKTPPNMYYAFPGIIIQKIFEHFYNDEWFLKRSSCREFMFNKAPDIFQNTLKWCNVDWSSKIAKKSKEEIFDEFLKMISINLDTVKEYKLLGSLAKSEHKLVAHFDNNKYVVLTSKIDFFIQTKDMGLIILDGKATSNKKNYLDNPSQLYFYAMMCKSAYGKYPDKIGYWWYKEGKISFVDYGEKDIDLLKEDMSDVLYKIYKKKFDATPEYKACLFCSYSEECSARKKAESERQASKTLNITEEDLLKDFG
jgi:hypothetical protein